MGKAYIGVNNISKNISKIYVGVDGIAKEVKKGYIGVDGIAKLFFEGGEIILPPSVATASYSGSGLLDNSWNTSNNYLICKKLGDFLFVSSNNYTGTNSAGQGLNGLYVVNMKTGTLNQITTANHTYMHAIELKENRYLISCPSIAFLYNGETETATQLSIGAGFNHKVSIGDKVIIRSQSSSVDLYMYDKDSERFTSLGLPYHDVISTSQGIFAYASYGTSTSYKRVYRFNGSTETFEEVQFTDKDGNVWSTDASYKSRLYEDRYGTVWNCTVAESTTPNYFNGTYMYTDWDGASTSPNFGYQNTRIFKLESDDCFIAKGKVWAFRGDSIEQILTTDGRAYFSSSVSFAVTKAGRTYMNHSVNSSATATYGMAFVICKDGSMEFTSLDSPYVFSKPNTALEIQGKVFLSGGGTTYEITGGDTNYGLTSVGAFNITAVFEVSGEIYAKNDSTIYKYEDGTFKSLVTKSAGNSMGVVQGGSFINAIGYYNTYNTGSESAIKTYNLINGEVKTLSTKVRYRLGQTAYVSTDSKVVHDVFGNSINSYNFSINAVTDYLTRGASATGYSNHNVLAYVSDINLSLLYEVPGEWEYKTVKWDTGEDVYETKIVKGGYLEEIEVTKDGYEFKGWYKDGEKFDFTQPVNGNITLTAEWEELTWEEVDYIESSGTQYIDTGVPIEPNLYINADIMITDTPNYVATLMGTTTNTTNYRFWICTFQIDTLKPNCALMENIISDTSLSTNTKYNIYVKFFDGEQKLYVDDVLLCSGTNTSTSTAQAEWNKQGNLLIGKANYSDTVNFVGKIFAFQMLDSDNTLIKDFVPIKLSNGEYAMLDKVNNQVYENKGTGEFNGGNIEPLPTMLEYVETTGTQYIDTGITLSESSISTLKIIADYQYTQSQSGSHFVFGYGMQFGVNWYNGNTLYGYFKNGNTKKTFTDGLSRHVYNQTGSSVYVDNTATLSPSGSSFSVGNIFLFANGDSGGGSSSGKLYSCKIYNDDTLVRDYKPAMDENGVVCLYDAVNSKKYYNAGTGDFIGG